MVIGEMLTRTLRVDCEIIFSDITHTLYEQILAFEPFGMGNPQPTFVTKDITIEDMRLVGADGRHVKLRLKQVTRNTSHVTSSFDAIAFGMGERSSQFHIGDAVDIVYTIDEDRWDGNNKLQLKIKDLTGN